MRFWFARDGQVPLREQLVTQVVLGILGKELTPGERLPSTRELARRFRLHPNTVSAGYRQLEEQKWVERRHGSGVYVRNEPPQPPASATFALDQQIQAMFRSAREVGAPLSLVKDRLRHWINLQPPDHFLLVEPDEELRAIVEAELRTNLKLRVISAPLEALRTAEAISSAIVVALPSRHARVKKALPLGTEFLPLKVRSVPNSLSEWLPARADILIAITSRWPEFLRTARTMLIAAGFPSESLVIRDARKAGWQRSVKAAVVVICDTLTAKTLPEARKIVFPVLSQDCIDELQRYEQFLSTGLD